MSKPLGYFVSRNLDNCAVLDSLEAEYGSIAQHLNQREKAVLVYKLAISAASYFSDQSFKEELNSLASKLQGLDIDSRLGLINFLMDNF